MTYYERNKEERKELNKMRALEYYYKNIEQRREYNKNYWKDNYIKLYSKRIFFMPIYISLFSCFIFMLCKVTIT